MSEIKWPEWQPISTAPKDGSSIILAVPSHDRPGEYVVGEAKWHESYVDDWWWAGNHPDDPHGGPLSEIMFHRPTHWLPLPPGPRGRIEEPGTGDEVAAGKCTSQPDTQIDLEEAIAKAVMP
jgi:hypothetical protein